MAVNRPVGQIILDLLERSTTFKTGISYENLYRMTCETRKSKVSRRDFQRELDKHQRDRRVQVEEDPRDRRAKRIFLRLPTPGDPSDYNAVFGWRLKEFLLDLFKKEGWLIPIMLWFGYYDPEEWNKTRPTVKELVRDYAWWKKYTEDEARELISTSRAIWGPFYRRYARDRKLLEKKAMEVGDIEAEVNAEEIVEGWLQRRPINRLRLLKILRERFAAALREPPK